MQGYDLDGTLAGTDFTQAGRKSMADIFTDAPVIHAPSTDFVVITARLHDTAAEREATLAWMAKNQPHFAGIHYVEAGSPEATAKAKAAVITRLKLTDFTDNNRDVLAALAGLDTGAKLWVMGTDGVRVAHRDAGAAGVVHSLWQVDGVRVLRADGGVVGVFASEQEAQRVLERLVAAVLAAGAH